MWTVTVHLIKASKQSYSSCQFPLLFTTLLSPLTSCGGDGRYVRMLLCVEKKLQYIFHVWTDMMLYVVLFNLRLLLQRLKMGKKRYCIYSTSKFTWTYTNTYKHTKQLNLIPVLTLTTGACQKVCAPIQKIWHSGMLFAQGSDRGFLLFGLFSLLICVCACVSRGQTCGLVTFTVSSMCRKPAELPDICYPGVLQ